MPNKEVIVRLIVSIVAVINAILVIAGKNEIAIADNVLYEVASIIAVIVIWIWGFWKNNSFTKEAKKADEYMHELKGERKADEQ